MITIESARDAATLLVATLPQMGLLGHWDSPVPCGQKLRLQDADGHDHGTLVIYYGKRGVRLLTGELTTPTPDILAALTTAWQIALDDPTARIIYPPPAAHSVRSSSDIPIHIYVTGGYHQTPTEETFPWRVAILEQGTPLHLHEGRNTPSAARPLRNLGPEVTGIMYALAWCEAHNYTDVAIHYTYDGLSAWAHGHWRPKAPYIFDYVSLVHNFLGHITWIKLGTDPSSLSRLTQAQPTGKSRAPSTRALDTTKQSGALLQKRLHSLPPTDKAPALASPDRN